MMSEKHIVGKQTGKRKRVKHVLTFEERLSEAARKARDSAGQLPPGAERESLLRQTHETKNTIQISKLITSPRKTTKKQKQLIELAAKKGPAFSSRSFFPAV